VACTTQRSQDIGDLAAGRLDAAKADELLDHLERCGECSAELDLVADIVAHFERPAGARAAIPRRRLGIAVAALAAAALLAASLWILSRPHPAPRSMHLASLASTQPLPTSTFVPRSGTPLASSPAYLDAMRHYAAGEFAEAARGLSLLAEERPDDPLVNLYLGISRLQTGAAEQALAPLERAATTGEDLLAERALWYLGNAHLVLEDGEAARRTFQRLAELGGDYEPNAREKLEAIASVLER
jgi:hypothetical protein